MLTMGVFLQRCILLLCFATLFARGKWEILTNLTQLILNCDTTSRICVYFSIDGSRDFLPKRPSPWKICRYSSFIVLLLLGLSSMYSFLSIKCFDLWTRICDLLGGVFYVCPSALKLTNVNFSKLSLFLADSLPILLLV